MQLLWASAKFLNEHALENLVNWSTLKQSSMRRRSMLYCFTAETFTVAQLGTHKLHICKITNWISEYKCKDLSEWECCARNIRIQELGLTFI